MHYEIPKDFSIGRDRASAIGRACLSPLPKEEKNENGKQTYQGGNFGYWLWAC